MKSQMFAVRDNKLEAYGQPFLAKNQSHAVRLIGELVNKDLENNFHKYPQDFTLFAIGEYDDSTGLCQSEDTPKAVMGLWEMKQEAQPSDVAQIRGA